MQRLLFLLFLQTATPSLQLTKKETPTQILVYTAPSTEQVLVMVRKINASTCSVSFQIEDVYLKRNNITFGSEFQDRGDGSYECMHFETKQATGFTTPEAVKREMLCQFNWSQISTNITELKVLNYGAFTHTPMVTLRFEAQYRD